jgi:hypothetical protein
VKILINLGRGAAVTVEPGRRQALVFDKEWNDPEKIHKDGAHAEWLPETAAYHLVTLNLIASGQAAGEKLKLAVTEYERDGGTRVKDALGEDKVGNGTKTEYTLSGLMWMDEKKRYRAEVENFGTTTVTVEKAYLKVAR